jgi:putative Holliday junction resolvase
MPRFLALDPGEVTVGIAVSDETGTLARPLTALPRKPHQAFLEALSELLKEYMPEAVILGLPLSTEGKMGKAAQKAASLAYELRTRLNIEVFLVDESYSTCEANDLLYGPLQGKDEEYGLRDKIAAALILERYLKSTTKL